MSAVVLLVLFTDSGVKRVGFRCQNGAEKVPQTTDMELQVCQSEPRDLQKHPLQNRVEKVNILSPRSYENGVVSLFFVFLFFNQLKSDLQKKHELHMQGVVLHHRATLRLQRGTTKDTQIKNI